ncbi:MAG: FAD-dependent oxidoreductase [Candidatus Curtissbacteria bacterium]|nr:FAD-dependent oxidoreductase [Candidatus Curtissbacteria bacterium]
MKHADFLIVGGSAAGTTAAEVIRSLEADSSIIVVTDEPHEEYSRVLLPQYVTHKVERENIFLKKADWYREKLIELIKLTRVTKLSAKEHKVTLESGEEIQYGKLLIAVGGFPLKLSVPGDDLENIHYLRTLEDADKFIESSKKGKKGVIVGGGLVSLDFAEGMRANGVEEVTILVREPYYWFGKLDRDSSRIIKSVLEKNGVAIAEGEEVDHFEGLGKVSKVVTKSQKSFDCDVVGVGIGIKSDFSWLEGSGIKIDRAIVTNEYLETSIEDIYAAGDCAQFHDVIFEREHIMGNWANATSQGAAVAKTMVGQRTVFESASFYSDTFFECKYSFIGVVDDNFADKIISRGSVESGKMTRIFIKTIGSVMIIVGATVINNPANVAPLTSIIKKKVDFSAYKEKFVDLSFDLNDIL